MSTGYSKRVKVLMVPTPPVISYCPNKVGGRTVILPQLERYPTEGVRSPLLSSGHGDLLLTGFHISEVVTDGHTPIQVLDPDLVTTETLRGDVLDGHQVRTWYQ